MSEAASAPTPPATAPSMAEPAVAPATRVPSVAWFGKLPALGDFASRRLHPEALQAWDACLSEGLQACRVAWGEAWLDHYLGAPVCRFVQGEDAEDGHPPAAGVLMPSVDRAGRYFPLLLVQALPALPRDDAGWARLEARLHGLAEAALGVLQPGVGVEGLEAALAALDVDEGTGTGTDTDTDRAGPGPDAGGALLRDLLRDRSLWWQGEPGPGRRTHLDARWPAPAAFSAWLRG